MPHMYMCVRTLVYVYIYIYLRDFLEMYGLDKLHTLDEVERIQLV